MALIRTTAGLLFRDQFDRADGAPGSDWTVIDGTWEIVSGRLRSSGTVSGFYRIRLSDDALAARNLMYVQCAARRFTDSDRPALLGRLDHTTGGAGSHYSIDFVVAWWYSNNKISHLYKTVAGTTTELQWVFQTQNTNTDYVLGLLCRDSDQRGYFEGAPKQTGSDTALNSMTGRAGLQHQKIGTASTGAEFSDFIVCSDNRIICTGLPTGWKLRVGALTATESSGTATLDLAGTILPAATVNVLDDSDVQQDTLSPADGVWGGDEYVYATMATASLDAAVLATLTKTASLDANTALGRHVSLDTAVQKTLTKTADLDAAAQKTLTKTADLDARAVNKYTLTADFDVGVFATLTKTADLDSAVQKTLSKTADFDTAAAIIATKTADLNAAVLKNLTRTADFDAPVLKTFTLAGDLDAAAQKTFRPTLGCDAMVVLDTGFLIHMRRRRLNAWF